MTPGDNIRIEKPLLMLVEGADDYWFFCRIIEKRLGIEDCRRSNVQIVQFAEERKLGDFLVHSLLPAIRTSSVRVRAIGIVRDADCFYDRAFQSVSDSLRRAGLPVPNSPTTAANGTFNGAQIRTTVYIMPDNTSSGDLESLCLRAIQDSPAMACVESYIECLKAQGQTVRYERKAKLHAFLVSNTDDPTLQPGQAIGAGIIPWNSPAFGDVHKFLDMLDAAG